MAAFNKFNRFVTDLALKVHDLNLDAVKIYLSNTAPSATLDSVKADLAEIATGNGYTGAVDISSVVTQNAGTMELSGTDQVFTAAGGAIAQFRYVVLFNDTPASPADPLIGWWDYGSALDVLDGETFTVDFGALIATLA